MFILQKQNRTQIFTIHISLLTTFFFQTFLYFTFFDNSHFLLQDFYYNILLVITSVSGKIVFILRTTFSFCLKAKFRWIYLHYDTIREHLCSPPVFGGIRVAYLFIFCVVLLCVFTFWIPCCGVRYDFRIKTARTS